MENGYLWHLIVQADGARKDPDEIGRDMSSKSKKARREAIEQELVATREELRRVKAQLREMRRESTLVMSKDGTVERLGVSDQEARVRELQTKVDGLQRTLNPTRRA